VVGLGTQILAVQGAIRLVIGLVPNVSERTEPMSTNYIVIS
jgi:hypothetical protein